MPERGAVRGPYAVLMVTDSGAGIAPEHLSHIFEPFFTTKGIGEGTGLGLSTVHGIVTQSRGQVWAESRPETGTTFTVLLPMVPAPSGVEAPPRPQRNGSGRTASVLVVDDEDIIRSLMKRTLESAGYSVLLARNGREALDALERHRGRVDLVLSDLVMPVMDGRELSRRLAAEHPGIAAVWMSGYPKDTMLVTGKGMLEPFLQKPVPPDLLVGTVSEVLERTRNH